MIFLHIILHSAVHIYDFLYIHNFIIWISVSGFDGFTVWLWIEDPVVSCHPTTTPDVHLKTNTNTKIAYITAMIFLHIILHSAVHIYDFLYIHNFIIWISVSGFDGFTVWLWIEDPVVSCHPTTTPDVHLKTNTNTRKLLQCRSKGRGRGGLCPPSFFPKN